MTIAIYMDTRGVRQRVDVPIGASIMEGAVGNLIAGITGECGGALACGTCHVVIDPQWARRTGTPTEVELQMLEVVDGRQETSRLCCQIRMTEELDGIIVRVPES